MTEYNQNGKSLHPEPLQMQFDESEIFSIYVWGTKRFIYLSLEIFTLILYFGNDKCFLILNSP